MQEYPNVATPALITLASAGAGTTTGTDADSSHGSGLIVFVNITAVTGSLTVTIQGKDVVSGQYYTILASAALTGTGLTVLKIYPSLTAAANLVANDVVPTVYRITAVVATGPVSATISAVSLG